MDTGTFVTVYYIFLFFIAFVSVLLVKLIWRWRHVYGSVSLIIMFIGEAIWSLFYVLHLTGFFRHELGPYFWSKLTFLGIVMVPASFFVWTAMYTHNDRLITKRFIIFLCIEPVIFNLVIWTDPWHGWFSGSYLTTGKLGIAFSLHTLYSYTLFLIAGIMHFINMLRAQPAYRLQTIIVFLALPVALSTNVITIGYTLPHFKVDVSPAGFIFTAGIITFIHLRHRLFDIIPIARHKVMDDIHDGVIVLDFDDRIVDMNPAAREMLGTDMGVSLGKPAETVVPMWDELLQAVPGKERQNIEFVIGEESPRYINLTMSPLTNRIGRSSGSLVLLSDISHIKTIENNLRRSNSELVQKIEEIEALQAQLKDQALRDPLTGLYNRRFLKDTFKREIMQAQRAHGLISLVIIDLDRFKNINDGHGHDVGDLFLISFANMLQEKMRKSDVLCRYGGEEFIIVMPGASLETAAARINMLCEEFSNMEIDAGSNSISATFSAGLAGYPFHGSDDKSIIAVADKALLRAKREGRNRVVVASADYSAARSS